MMFRGHSGRPTRSDSLTPSGGPAPAPSPQPTERPSSELSIASIFAGSQQLPSQSLIVVIPAGHALALERVRQRPVFTDGDAEIIVACAGQPVERPAIHAHFRDAHFLLAPAETPSQSLRRLAAEQATGDILCFVDGVAPGSNDRGAAPLPLVSIVIPVRNAAALVQQSLESIAGAELAREQYEIIVVDDASSDGSATAAAGYADTVIRLTGGARGASYARNRGAELARGELLVFIDAGVCVRRNTFAQLVNALQQQPASAAAAAVNDGAASDGGVPTQYWNLLQQHAAQSAGSPVIHFNASCGIVRREAFRHAGMFDEWHYAGSSVEELDLGNRLHEAGYHVELMRDAGYTNVGSHGIGGVLRRAWSRSAMVTRMIGFGRSGELAPTHPIHALGSGRGVAAAAAVLAIALAAVRPTALWISLAAIAVAGVLFANLGFLGYIAKRRGLTFAVAAAPLHFATQVAVAGGRLSGWIMRNTIGNPGPDATTQAFAEVGVSMWPPVARKP